MKTKAQRHVLRFTLYASQIALLFLITVVAQSASPPRYGGTLQHAILQPVTTLDTVNYLNFAELQVALNLYEGLVKHDRFGRIVSAIAQSWTHTDDHRIWTFAIAKGAKFHDSAPVTASDVKRAWERTVRDGHWIVPPFPLHFIEGAERYRNGLAEQISGIRVTDDSHVQVTLKDGDAEFLAKLTAPAAWITAGSGRQPVGTGRFHLVFYNTTEIRLTANLDYVWGRPYLDEVTFRYYADARKALFDFESGVLDVLPLPFTAAASRQDERRDEIVFQSHAAGLVYLRLKSTDSGPPVWHDILKYAIDIDALLRLQYGVQSPRIASPVLPCRFNPVKARRRLKHVGWDTTQSLNLTYAPLPDNTGSAIATRLQRDYLFPIGLQIDPKAADPNTFQQSLIEARDDLALLSMPLSEDFTLTFAHLDQTVPFIPLYLLSSSFLCQANMRGMDAAWGGAITYDNVWLAR